MPEDFLPGLLETLELRMIKPGKANPLTGLLTSPETLGAGSEIGYTDEQGQFQVTNPEARKVFFDRFFEGSKVVDEEGNPLVVYHGTGSDIKAFDKSGPRVKSGKLGKGIYMTPSKQFANLFAQIRSKEGAPNVIPLYASIKNPFIIQGEKNLPVGEISRDSLIKLGYDGIFLKDEDGKIKEAVAFDPSQLKSIFNRGTFNPKDPDILSMNQTQKGLIYG